MKFSCILKEVMESFGSVKPDGTERGEQAAMGYGDDIYVVLLHDRATRQRARAASHGVDYRRDAGWPFIR